MAEQTSSEPAELGAPMDYDQHWRTFAGFVALAKITILATAITMIALALYGFGRGGFWLGTLLIVLMLIAAGLGLVGKGTIKPLVVVTAVGVILAAISLG